MSESQRPKPATPSFDIPDLELQPLPRSLRSAPDHPVHGAGAPNLFEEDPFEAGGGLSLDLDHGAAPGVIDFGSSIQFDAVTGFELEPSAPPAARASGPTSAVTRRADAPQSVAGDAGWPTGRVPNAETLSIDAVELALIADYGTAPQRAHLTPAYAYRVFTRQRQLKAELAALCAERDCAERDRETILAELTRTMRPVAEAMDAFRRLFAPLIDLEQVVSQRGLSLSAINAELGAKRSAFDTELAQISEQRTAQEVVEQAALRSHADRDQRAQRTLARLNRLHIEIRAVTQVAEQKLGPRGGQVPEPEASQLAGLQQSIAAIQPEVTRAKAELDQAKAELSQARSRLGALRQAERTTARKQQAVGDSFQQELQVQSAGLSETEAQQRAALAEIGRALLAGGGAVPISAAWLERVRAVSERADRLIFKCEALRRALDAYDRARVAQGVRLACTAFGLLVFLLVLKIAL